MRGRRWSITSSLAGLLALLGVVTVAWGTQVRVATYNIQFLSTEVVNQGDHLSRLREVIAALDADVIGLQEIADRAALRHVFPPTARHGENSSDVSVCCRA